MKFSDRLIRMKPSATRATAEKAAQLVAEGKRVISFTTGEPDFTSPPAVLEAANKAMLEGHTHYTATAGINELKKAVADYYKERHKVSFRGKEICIGAGAKALIYEALGVLVNPGDEVIVPVPAWVSYMEQIDVFDGVVKTVDTTATDFIPTLESIEKALSPRTVAVIINSPHNPTGAVYGRELLADLCRLAVKRNFMLINDEVYERLTYGVSHVNPLADVPEARDHLLSINGASKAYAMTGWRIGFAMGPEALIAKLGILQGHVTSSACSIAQWATVGAIRNAQADVDRMVAEYARRLEFAYAELTAMPHIKVTKPKGAFYFFVDVRPSYGKKAGSAVISDDQSFCAALLEHGVALVPGAAFVMPGFARLSYACAMDELREGLAAIRAFLNNLS